MVCRRSVRRFRRGSGFSEGWAASCHALPKQCPFGLVWFRGVLALSLSPHPHLFVCHCPLWNLAVLRKTMAGQGWGCSQPSPQWLSQNSWCLRACRSPFTGEWSRRCLFKARRTQHAFAFCLCFEELKKKKCHR